MNIRRPMMPHALEACSEFFSEEVTLERVRKRSKRLCHVQPRQFVVAWLRAHTDMSYPQIARLCNQADHTTPMSNDKRAWQLWGDDPRFVEAMTPIVEPMPNKGGRPPSAFKNGDGWKDAA